MMAAATASEAPAPFDPSCLVFEAVDFGKQQWHSVVNFPEGAEVAVLDLSNGADAEEFNKTVRRALSSPPPPLPRLYCCVCSRCWWRPFPPLGGGEKVLDVCALPKRMPMIMLMPMIMPMPMALTSSSPFGQVWTVGRYDENRSIYKTDLFTTPEGPRCVHVGVDLGGPVGTPVYACSDGVISSCG